MAEDAIFLGYGAVSYLRLPSDSASYSREKKVLSHAVINNSELGKKNLIWLDA